jgi:hypothetical protein
MHAGPGWRIMEARFEEPSMHPRRVLLPVLVLAALAVSSLSGCKDQREPVKPIVDLSIVVAN